MDPAPRTAPGKHHIGKGQSILRRKSGLNDGPAFIRLQAEPATACEGNQAARQSTARFRS